MLHLFRAQRFDEAWALVEDPTWRLAKFRELGSDVSFLDDLQFAIMSAEQQQAAGLPRLMQYSLLDSLLRALAAVTPVPSLESPEVQFAHQSILKRAETIVDPRRRVEALMNVTRLALDAGQYSIAVEAIKQAEPNVELVEGVYIRAKLLVDVAGAKTDIGQPEAAQVLLQRAQNLLGGILTKQRKYADDLDKLKLSDTKIPTIKILEAGITPSKTFRQQGVGDTAAAQAGIYAIIASTWAKLGKHNLAQDILVHLKPVVNQMTETELNLSLTDYSPIQGLVEAIRQFIGLGELDLAEQTLDTFRPTYGSQARRLLNELAQDLCQKGYTRIAMQIVDKILAPPLGDTNTASLQDKLMAELATTAQDMDSLQMIANAAPKTEERRALTAVLLRYVQLGSIELATKVAQKSGPAVRAHLAAYLIGEGNPTGQEMLDQVVNSARSQQSNRLKHSRFSQIARALAEAGLIQQAIVVWDESQTFAAEDEYEPTLFITDQEAVNDMRKETLKTVSVIASGLARSGQNQKALGMVETLKSISDRVEALTAIATSLARVGNVVEARQTFKIAHSTARSVLRPEDRAYALEDLLDGLLAAQEFEWAFQVARSIDRLNALENYTSEPGLVFKKAKDLLARAVGLPEDEDLAFDTAPDFQVRVVTEIAEAGDYNLASHIASQIKNISVQDDIKSEIAYAAARAQDHAAAYAIADEVVDHRDILFETLVAEAAQSGALSQALLANKDYQAGRALAFTALAARMAANGQSADAQTLLELVAQDIDNFTDDESDKMYRLGELIRLAGRAGYSDAVTFFLKRIRDKSEVASDLAEIGWADEALKYGDAYEYGMAGLHLARQGEHVAALAIAEKLTGSDDIRECVALQHAINGQYADARQIAQSIKEKSISDETHQAIAIMETTAQGLQAAHQNVERLLSGTDNLEDLSEDVIAALVFSLVIGGYYALALKLVKAIPKPDEHWKLGKRGHAALALVQAAAQAHLILPGQELVEMVEVELRNDSKITGLEQIATWTVIVFPQVGERILETIFRAMQTARSQGHYEVLLHISGLAPLLDGLGGVSLTQETIQRLQVIEEVWF